MAGPTVDNGTLTDYVVAVVDTTRVTNAENVQVTANYPQAGTVSAGTQTTITSSATSILAADSTRCKVIIQWISGGTCRIGKATVTTSTGWYELGDGALAMIELEGPEATAAIEGIRTGASNAVVLTHTTVP